jgi:hypothetical protein
MSTPTKWWQWFLVYPTLITSIIAAIPTFHQIIRSYQIGVPYANVAKAEEQRLLWERNYDCIRENVNAVVATTKTNDIVKAGACKDTGDIIIEVNKADGTKIARWVSFQKLCEPCVVELITDSAFAMEPKGRMEIEMICQKWIDKKHLYRRVKVGNTCYDEMVNTYTGEIVMRATVPCVECTEDTKLLQKR